MRDVILGLIASDGAELQEANTDSWLNVGNIRAVFAAPRLVLNASVIGYCTPLLPIVSNQPPYSALQVNNLQVAFGEDNSEAEVLAFAAAVAAHDSLKGLSLRELQSARGLNALVDAAAERRVSRLWIEDCVLDAEFVPALARLLQRGSLTTIEIWCARSHFPLAQEESMPALCAALRSCHTLTDLDVCLNPPEGATNRTVTELLDAAASLPALSRLNLSASEVQDAAAFGRALGALLRADLPSLHALDVCNCGLGDEFLAPLLDGLAGNTHLRELDCDHNNPSDAFYRDRLEPALAALAARAELNA